MTGPTERPPVEPVLATQHSAAGAKAFAEFFIRTIDWGYATTSSAYMRHYFQPSCEQCEVIARLLDNAARAGAHYIGGRLSIKSSKLVSGGATPTVNLGLLVTAIETVDRTGKPKEAEPAYPNFREHIVLTWQFNAWHVVQMEGHK